MKTTLIVLLLFALFGQCSSSTEQTLADVDPLTIRTGSSFGMCVGNSCRKEYVFNGTSVTLVQSGARTQSPAQTCQRTISATEWNALKAAAANFDAFSQQPAVIGCPDCADGGAEYIELEQGDRRHRVTFPFSKTVPGFDPLVNALRQQREQFTECK